MLDEALPVLGASHALQGLHKRFSKCFSPGRFPHLVVQLACDWACFSATPCLSLAGNPLYRLYDNIWYLEHMCTFLGNDIIAADE